MAPFGTGEPVARFRRALALTDRRDRGERLVSLWASPAARIAAKIDAHTGDVTIAEAMLGVNESGDTFNEVTLSAAQLRTLLQAVERISATA